ncbi:hypothetical protein [Bacillus sp. WC2507]|uniref:hypothetical protein n=1 Tax=Bacillus sp. WC2507 TaxID=3461404 RepID=UPI0040431A1C
MQVEELRKAKRKRNASKEKKVKERAEMLPVEELRKAKRKRNASKEKKVKERATCCKLKS